MLLSKGMHCVAAFFPTRAPKSVESAFLEGHKGQVRSRRRATWELKGTLRKRAYMGRTQRLHRVRQLWHVIEQRFI